jgi:hypothetical protein
MIVGLEIIRTPLNGILIALTSSMLFHLQRKVGLAGVVGASNKIFRVLLGDVQSDDFAKDFIGCHSAEGGVLADGRQLHFLIREKSVVELSLDPMIIHKR